MAFIQEDFTYQDLFSENTYLQDVVSHYAPQQYQKNISDDLAKFSKRVCSDVLAMSQKAEREEPVWVPYDPWGKKIDDILMSDGWLDLHRVSAEEGIVATAYERKSGEYSRFHQLLKLMLFHPSSAYYSCPLAMTDGATRVLELCQEQGPKDLALPHLLSRDPDVFWTAGQWMTEKTGGSDLSRTETVAELENGTYRLYGQKWFTSAITANITMTLARTIDPESGKEGLTLFFVRIRDDKGQLNNIDVLRLKEKLGTRAMPTAELELKGCEATMIGGHGKGVKNIATVLNISRMYNAVCATGVMYRLHSLSRDYATKREAFGKAIGQHPLHVNTLFDTQTIVNASVHLISELAVLMGKVEVGEATEEESHILRIMIPVAKLWTGKRAVSVVSELIESFGGAGYIEDTGLPIYLRDTQVLSIWEGTTNILSLDALRALSKPGIFESLRKNLGMRVSSFPTNFSAEKQILNSLLTQCDQWLEGCGQKRSLLEAGGRQFTFVLAHIYCTVLLVEFAAKTQKTRDRVMAQRFCHNIEAPDFIEDQAYLDLARETLFS